MLKYILSILVTALLAFVSGLYFPGGALLLLHSW